MAAKVGLCGQAPSDHPELAGLLASIGIDSISVTPDALPRVVRHLAALGEAPAVADEACRARRSRGRAGRESAQVLRDSERKNAAPAQPSLRGAPATWRDPCK
jgi:phosphoenolpyruvate-protein kinase (PTS system EI component)